MKDDRLRVPVDPPYIVKIGLATYCFAQMEWNAVYCGEKLMPGYVNKIAWKTAGMIAKDILGFAPSITDPQKQARYHVAVKEFKRLVVRRNHLVHANPATFDGEQRLVRHGTPWLPDGIDDLADEFTACSIELNELHHRVL